MAVTQASLNIANLVPLRAILFRLGINLNDAPELMETIAQYALTQIKKRTLEGQDAEYRQFEPYSDRYAMFRREHGRPTGNVDLFFTGSMQASMTSDIGHNSVKLYFGNTRDKNNVRNPLKAYFLNQTRNFFALSESDIQGIVHLAEEYIQSLF